MSSYKIPFVSLSGNRYDIRIYPTAEGYTEDAAVILHGGAEPIVTEEDKTTEIPIPARSSSGHINIVTSDITFQEHLMPTTADGMRVTLVRYPRSDEYEQVVTVAWEGYICPESFTQDWSAGPWEIQIPIVSRLGMVLDDYLSDSNTGILTIGAWLARICGDVYKYVLIPDDELASSGTMQWGPDTLPTPTVLQLAFSEEIFKAPISLQERDNPSDTTRGLWDPGTNNDIATSLSAMLRWELHEYGDTLVCFDPGSSTSSYLRYSADSLLSADPVADGSVSIDYLDISELGERWSDTRLGAADGTVDVLMPFGKVSLDGATGKFDSTAIDPNKEDWQKVGGIPYVNGAPEGFGRPDTLPFELYDDDSATIKSQKVIDNPELETYIYFAKSTSVISNGAPYVRLSGDRLSSVPIANERASMTYCNAFPSVIFGQQPSDPPLSHGDYFGGGEVSAIHYFYARGGEPPTYVHYRLNSIILGKIYTTSTKLYPAVRLRSTAAQLLPHSSRKKSYVSLCISGTVTRGRYYNNIDIGDNCDGDGFYGIQVSVKIGDYYLDKATWGGHQCSLSTNEVPIDILWTKHEENQFCEYIRLGITDQISMTLDAPLEITIYTPTDAPRPEGRTLANNCKYLRINNFSVKVCEQEDDDDYDFSETLVEEPDSSISFSQRIGSNKLEEKTISTSFGGPDNPGALYSDIPVTISGARTSMMPTRKVGTYDGANDGARYLCRRTFDWLVTQGSSTRHAIQVPLLTERPWSVPAVSFISYDGISYYPAARSCHWRDDITNLTLIEIRHE